MTALALLRPNLDAFASPSFNYIKACDKRVTKLREKLQAEADGRPIIGVSWFTKAKIGAALRSLSIVDLINQLPEDAYIVNLQYGNIEPDRKKLKRHSGKDLFVDTGVDNENDIDGLCALIGACDRIVSVDNATVHFAGALGKTCDVLLPFTGDWRWGLNWRQESYWYSSLTLHRQVEPWDWSPALISLKLALENR
jgi:ADP-heptose:LPS heptosyltransferase